MDEVHRSVYCEARVPDSWSTGRRFNGIQRDASMIDARPPSRFLHLQIDGENRFAIRDTALQVRKKTTLTQSLMPCFVTLIAIPKHPVRFTGNLAGSTRFVSTIARIERTPCKFP